MNHVGLINENEFYVELFIRVVHDNGGKLSSNKRRSHFDWMSDDEVLEAETVVREAFARM